MNGKEVKIYRGDYAFRTLPVPPGESSIQWKYDPILFKIGSVITALTAFVLAVYFSKSAAEKRRAAG